MPQMAPALVATTDMPPMATSRQTHDRCHRYATHGYYTACNQTTTTVLPHMVAQRQMPNTCHLWQSQGTLAAICHNPAIHGRTMASSHHTWTLVASHLPQMAISRQKYRDTYHDAAIAHTPVIENVFGVRKSSRTIIAPPQHPRHQRVISQVIVDAPPTPRQHPAHVRNNDRARPCTHHLGHDSVRRRPSTPSDEPSPSTSSPMSRTKTCPP